MNIFVLSQDPREAARMHLDKHVVKMIIEYAQLLSTAHRLLDGRFEVHQGPNTKPKKFWLLEGESVREEQTIVMVQSDVTEFLVEQAVYKLVVQNPQCYSLSHQNHPCAVWARESDTNYRWLYSLFEATSLEYTHRYGKTHKTWADLKDFLRNPPKNIAAGDLTTFPQAMGDEFKVTNDPVAAYRNYYLGPKAEFARWTNRAVPTWFSTSYKDYDASAFSRTTALG